MPHRRIIGTTALRAAFAVGLAWAAVRADSAPATPATITVVGNRADLVSGGDALVDIALPATAAPSAVRSASLDVT